MGLMDHVDWRNVPIAIRYIDLGGAFGNGGATSSPSRNDCVATISQCATNYVRTAVQRGYSTGEVSDSTGVRKQDSQTSWRFWRAEARLAVRREGQGPDSPKARADPGDRLNGPSWFRCRL